MKIMTLICTLVTCGLTSAFAEGDSSTPRMFNLSVETLGEYSDMVVKRVLIETEIKPEEQSFGIPIMVGGCSHGMMASGYRKDGTPIAKASILLITSRVPGDESGKSVFLIKLKTSRGSSGAPNPCMIDSSSDMRKVLNISVAKGAYPFRKSLQLGTFSGKPIKLLIGWQKKKETDR